MKLLGHLESGRPFRGKTRAELLEQLVKFEPRPLRQLDDTIPKELERICLKALSKKASDRYTIARDLADALGYAHRVKLPDGDVGLIHRDVSPTNVLVSYVIIFIFFGAFLRRSGASRFFIDVPLALAGRTTGGPAKVACVTSGLFGTVSGSAVANTATTGTFTIPMMRSARFPRHIAGGITAAAASGSISASLRCCRPRVKAACR